MYSFRLATDIETVANGCAAGKDQSFPHSCHAFFRTSSGAINFTRDFAAAEHSFGATQ
jgi:hypothetical protein